jgi:hypothetical protein
MVNLLSSRSSSAETAPQVTGPTPLSVDILLETDRTDPSDARFEALEAKQEAAIAHGLL